MKSNTKPHKVHPLRRWMANHPNTFHLRRDSRRVFGVWPSFLSEVLAGKKHPSAQRAFEWERITGIPAKQFIMFGRKPRSSRSPGPFTVLGSQ